MTLSIAPTTPRDFAPPDREVADLAASLALRMTKAWGSGWIVAETAGSAVRLRGRKLEAAIGRAEEAGLVERQDRSSGTWIRLAGLGVSLFGPDRRVGRPRVIADGGPIGVEGILAELASTPSALVLAEALAASVGRDIVEAWEILEDAARGGWVELWPDHPRGPCAMLSALSAGRLGLRLSSDGSAWLRDGEKDPTRADRFDAPTETDCSAPGSGGIFSETADPGSPEGLASLIGSEEADRLAAGYREAKAAEEAWSAARNSRKAPRRSLGEVARMIDGGDLGDPPAATIPRPTMLVGIGRPWPFAGDASGARDWGPSDGPCPGCGGARLPASAVCCVCWRSGVDHLLPSREESRREAELEDRWMNRGIKVPDRFRNIAG